MSGAFLEAHLGFLALLLDVQTFHSLGKASKWKEVFFGIHRHRSNWWGGRRDQCLARMKDRGVIKSQKGTQEMRAWVQPFCTC